MECLSDNTVSFIKRKYPIACVCLTLFLELVAGAVAFKVAFDVDDPPNLRREAIPLLLAAPLLIGLLVYGVVSATYDSLVDEVWDAGDRLVVRNNDQEFQIPLSDCKRLDYWSTRPPKATIRLHGRSPLGTHFVFEPRYRFHWYGTPPHIRALQERIQAAQPIDAALVTDASGK